MKFRMIYNPKNCFIWWQRLNLGMWRKPVYAQLTHTDPPRPQKLCLATEGVAHQVIQK